MTHTILHIKGMHCASCVGRVEAGLRGVPGVSNASINLVTSQAVVTHDPTQASVGAVIDAVRRAGYDVVQDGEQPGGAQRVSSSMIARLLSVVQPWVFPAAAIMAAGTLMLAMIWHSSLSVRIQFFLATPIQLILGYPFYRGAWRSLLRLRANMDTLVVLGTTVAYLYSVVAMTMGFTTVYFDTAAVILVLVSFGQVLESRAKHSAASAIESLMDLQAPQAIVIRNDQESVVGVDEVVPGDVVLVKPGQKIPVDGVVVQGQSTVDRAVFTGESEPVEVGPDSQVNAGTVNLTGAFEFRTTQTGQSTLLAQIVEMVSRAQGSKADIQRLVDKIASVFVPVVLAIALLTLGGWSWIGHWQAGLQATVAVLVVACPCALGLATPTAITVAIGLGAQHGILIKDAVALERGGRLSHVILDKTGTLTIGRSAVKQVVVLQEGWESDQLLQLAASVESHSEHPVAKAIVDHAHERNLELQPVFEFQSTTGVGIKGRVNDKRVVVGRVSALRDEHMVGVEAMLEQRDELLQHVRTAVAIGIDGQAVGLIGLSERLKPNARGVVRQLNRLGLQVTLMTGDHPLAAESVAHEVGINSRHIMAEVMPADKQKQVEQLQKQGHIVAMVGDGINDAPALATADIGVAMGGGTDIAMEAGHVVLVGGDLAALPRAVRLSRATMKRIYAGLFWAFSYNLLLIPIAVAGLLHPMLGAGAMSCSSVSVVLNALWLRRRWRP